MSGDLTAGTSVGAAVASAPHRTQRGGAGVEGGARSARDTPTHQLHHPPNEPRQLTATTDTTARPSGAGGASAASPLGPPQTSLRRDPRGRRDWARKEETDQARDERRAAERKARARRYERRDRLRPLASLERLRTCGRKAVTDGGVTVGVRTDTDGSTHAGYGGVSTCGSTWACPQCAVVIATRRADELADVMRSVDALGGSAFMVTLTVRHALGDRLGWDRQQRRRWESLEKCRRARKRAAEGLPLNVGRVYQARTWVDGEPGDDGEQNPDTGHVCDVQAEQAERAELEAARGSWDAVTDGWEAVTSGAAWVKDQKRHGGLLGWSRVIETTDGANGWHCHAHCLVAFAEDVTEDDVRPMVRRMFERWKRAVERAGFDASGDFAADGRIPGWHLVKAELGNNDLAAYFVKLAHEITSHQAREGRRPGGRTPTQLASDAVDTYSERDVARLIEWQRTSQGRRQLTWSGGQRSLRALAGLGPEQSDQEIAEEQLPADERLRLAPECWGWVKANDFVTVVIDVAEIEGLDGLARWLTAHGQQFVTGAGLDWVERPPEEPGRPVYDAAGDTIGWQRGVIARDQGVGLGFATEAAPAVLRERDALGRPLRRPSDRPPRWTDEARGALVDSP